MVEFCPECRQPLPPAETINGVRLTKFKAELFHYIESHPGRTSTELAQYFYPDKLAMGGTVRSHIFQINELLSLADAGVQIHGGNYVGYRIKRSRA